VTFNKKRSYSEETKLPEGNTKPLNLILELIELKEDKSREVIATLKSVINLENNPLDIIVA
jgi:hypothetical protein